MRTFKIFSEITGDLLGEFQLEILLHCSKNFGKGKGIKKDIKSGDFQARREIQRFQDGVIKDRMNWTTSTDITYKGFTKIMESMIKIINKNFYEGEIKE